MSQTRTKRKARITRKTRETEINCSLCIEGRGASKISTGIGLLDHMLELFAFHGFFDLELKVVKSDLSVDLHHTNEDAGIVLGQAFRKALAKMQGIRRFGFGCAPMEEALARVAVDISGRGYFKLSMPGEGEGALCAAEKGYSLNDLRHFFEGFAKHLGINLNITIDSAGADLHATLEPAFKALGIALDAATEKEPRRKGVPSTKGVID